MSFILDALKKSESERQLQGGAEFASVPVSRPSSRPPAWLWVLAALLLVNLVVLAGVMLRPAATTPARIEPPAPAERFEERVAVASRELGEAAVEAPAAAASPPTATNSPAVRTVLPDTPQQAPEPQAAEQPPASEPVTPGEFDSLPDVDQLRASGELPASELRLDIHVYSDVPSDRFVFINMVKHREGSSTADGLTVDTITPEGVVLDYRGRRFLLPRQ